jgi:hypothetical protein
MSVQGAKLNILNQMLRCINVAINTEYKNAPYEIFLVFLAKDSIS